MNLINNKLINKKIIYFFVGNYTVNKDIDNFVFPFDKIVDYII